MIYIVDIESIPTRYTSQWKTWIPDLVSNVSECSVIEGNLESVEAQDGAFFNFYKTNIYKAQQTEQIAKLFDSGLIKDGDVFLFTDGWHPGVISLRQMINISKIDVKMYGMFHAGAYDTNDILAQTGGRKHFLNFETSLLESLDKSFFATDFSKELMASNLNVNDNIKDTMIVTGFPYDISHLYSVSEDKKENIILFPHRISPEKHPEMFQEISILMEKLDPSWKCIVTMDVCNNKDEYHELLSRAKYSISFSDQETWGISVFESLYSNCIPIVPNKLSYQEMYDDDLKYNDKLINQCVYKKIIDKIICMENNRESILENNKKKVNKFLSFDKILEIITS